MFGAATHPPFGRCNLGFIHVSSNITPPSRILWFHHTFFKTNLSQICNLYIIQLSSIHSLCMCVSNISHKWHCCCLTHRTPSTAEHNYAMSNPLSQSCQTLAAVGLHGSACMAAWYCHWSTASRLGQWFSTFFNMLHPFQLNYKTCTPLSFMYTKFVLTHQRPQEHYFYPIYKLMQVGNLQVRTRSDTSYPLSSTVWLGTIILLIHRDICS